MALTIREEVLRNSGLLTEEILEEGAFKKALITAAIIAGIGGAVAGGGKLSKDVKQYKSVKDKPVATRYADADAETNKDIQNKEYMLGYGGMDTAYTAKYKNMDYVDSIKSEYNERNNQAILHIYVDNHVVSKNTFNKLGIIEMEIRQALADYVKNLNKEYSGIEDKMNAIKGQDRFRKTPLKVVVHFTTKVPESSKSYNLSKEIQKITGTDSIEYKYDYESKY